MAGVKLNAQRRRELKDALLERHDWRQLAHHLEMEPDEFVELLLAYLENPDAKFEFPMMKDGEAKRKGYLTVPEFITFAKAYAQGAFREPADEAFEREKRPELPKKSQ